MKINSVLFVTVSLILVLSFLINCKKDALKVPPTVTISEASNITANSATVGSTITADGGSEVLSRGVVWSTSNGPTTTDNKTSDGKGKGSYSSSLTSLSPGTTYNLRSYATNAIGTAYSSQTSLKTLAILPVLTTADLSSITSSSVDCGGDISNDGGSSVTTRGVCWSINQNPTITDSKTSDGNGSGLFKSSIIGLIPGTTYYVRAYATNSIGTSYGNQLTAVTVAVLPTLNTTELTSVTSTSATSGGNISSDGGAAITARGVCWSLSQNPTINDNKTSDGTGSGIFSSYISGLSPAKTYYIKSYATNGLGTAYGTQVTLTTAATIPTITTVSASLITSIGATLGGNISDNGGATITERGVYCGITDNPETMGNKFAATENSNVFSVILSDLLPNTTYYVKAYAVNSKGKVYGNQVSFKTDELNTAVVDVSLNKKWDYWVIGKDGSNYYVKLINNRPAYSYFQFDPQKTGYYVTFNEFGLPSEMVIQNYVLLFSNYRSNLVDVAVVSPNGDVNIQRDVKGNINLDLFYRKSLLTDLSFALNLTSDAIGIASCIGGLAAAATGIGIPAAILLGVECGTTLVGIYSPLFEDSLQVLGWSATAISTFRDAAGCLELKPQDCYSLSVSGAAGYVDAANALISMLDIPAVTSLLLRPTVKATEVSSVTSNSAVCRSIVLSDGGAPITTKGVCWSTTPSPKININNFTTDGTGSGDYSSSITGLAPNTLYYVLAYATNSSGTSYGGIQLTFTTSQIISLATLTTTGATSIATASATSGGNITSDGGASVTTRGVCWSTSQNPNTTNSKTTNGTGTGSFTSSITGLSSNTTYYVRAYATNSIGTAYGTQVSFTTNQTIDIPTVTTNQISSITQTTASSGGNVTSDGNSTVTARGVCWSTSSSPTTSNSKTTNSSGIGSFTSSITGLSANTTYYVRAYATNGEGTAYGSNVSFTTNAIQAQVPTLTTTAASSIAMTSATSGGNITSDGGASVTSRGVCWSTSQNPTTSSNSSAIGSGTGSFSGSITGLNASTTYYVRAYAINSAGTAYGSQISFTTSAASQAAIPSLSTTAASSIASTSATSGGNITSDGGASVTSRGVCWSTSQNPTTSSNSSAIGSGTGSFSGSITGLNASTTYYVRAYAINSAGTAYGSQISFTTSAAAAPTVVPALGTYGACNVGIVNCSSNVTFGLEMINTRIVSINKSTHQIVFEIKKCDGSKFGTGGNWTVISSLCGGSGSVTYGTGSFISGTTSFQMTVLDNSMVSSKAYVPYIVQTANTFTYYYSAPAMVITY